MYDWKCVGWVRTQTALLARPDSKNFFGSDQAYSEGGVPAKPVLSEETHTFHHSEGRVGQKALLSGRWRPPIYWQWQPNPPFVHELGKNLTVRVPPLVRESTLHGT